LLKKYLLSDHSGRTGIYLGGFQIRMPQKTAYGLDGHTVREQHGGGVRMPAYVESDRLRKEKQTGED